MPVQKDRPKLDRLGVVLRVGVYVFLLFIGMIILPRLMLGDRNYLVASALGTFAAAAIANAVVLRIYERGQLADIGLGWNHASRHNLGIGLAAGIAAGLAVTLLPVILRAADLIRAPGAQFQAPSFVFISIVLLFGAVGEEMLFRGYAFQLLIGYIGQWATILPFAVLFAFMHLSNPNQNTIIGPLNTALWGLLLGYAFIRSGDLWLPIGIHFGWNWTLPIFGVNLSGFTMGVTGIGLQWRAADIWSGGQYGPEGGLITTMVVIALTWILSRMPVEQQSAPLVHPAED
jgi:membrane protease YdiL (CAAX protease family)